MARDIDYGNLMHKAMRGLIRDVLDDVAANGLPGQHHFFITFDTTHPDAELADWLSDRYPGEMTVVMQHWFDDLDVRDDGFSVSLNFGEQPERLYIPYDAIRTFVDPSVEFGLRFESGEDEDEAPEEATLMSVESEIEIASEEEDRAAMAITDDDEPSHADAEVVSLDSFRK